MDHGQKLVNPALVALLAFEASIEGLAAFAPQNNLNEVITPANQRRIPVPSGVVSGDPLLCGKLAGVAVTSYSSSDGMATVVFDGSCLLTVFSETKAGSPPTTSDLIFGDVVYATGGTLDATTNVTTGFNLSKDSTGTPFGNMFDSAKLAGGTSAAVLIRLKLGGGAS